MSDKENHIATLTLNNLEVELGRAERKQAISEEDKEYRAGRLCALFQRTMGLAGKNLAKEINGNCRNALLDEVCSADVNTFDSDDCISAFFSNTLTSAVYALPRRVGGAVNETGLGSILGVHQLDCLGTHEQRIFDYLYSCTQWTDDERNNKFLTDYERKTLELCRTRIFILTLTFLRGLLTKGDRKVTSAVLTRALLDEAVPLPYISELIATAIDSSLCDPATLNEVFNDVLDLLSNVAQKLSLFESADRFTKPLMLLRNLLAIKLNDNTRPICNLLLTPFRGFEMDDIPKESKEFVYSSFRGKLQSVQKFLHEIMHQILANAGSREAALSFFARIIQANEKKTQMQADNAKLATDGFMLNILVVLFELSAKVTLDKVHPHYLFHPKSRVNVAQQTRLKLTLDDTTKFAETLDVAFDVKFPTECFYLTMAAQHVAFHSAIQYFGLLLHNISDLERRYKELEREAEALDAKTQALEVRIAAMELAAMLDLRLKMTKHQYAYEATLMDEGFLARALTFSSSQLAFLVGIVASGGQSNDARAKAETLFGAYPEFYLENSLDLIVFLLKTAPKVLFDWKQPELPQHLLFFICNTELFNNPYLAKKVVDVLFSISPYVMPTAHNFFQSVIRLPLAIKQLVPGLVKLYSGIEESSAHPDEKYNIRLRIQIVFRALWEDLVYRSIIIEFTSDATHLLDESLDRLKKIHDIEAMMDNSSEWNEMPQEQREMKKKALDEATLQVGSYLLLGRETMHLFGYLTRAAPEPFCTEELLGEQLATMLNYNIAQLCGPKCDKLNVKDAIVRFKWNPKELICQIVEIYLNLESEKFAELVSQEGSFKPELFPPILDRLDKFAIVPSGHIESLRNLTESAARFYRQKEEFDDIPDEFLVRLPSGHLMDRKNIKRHMLTSATNPLTRQPLKESDLVPDAKLKTRINEWIEMKRHEVTAVASPVVDSTPDDSEMPASEISSEAARRLMRELRQLKKSSPEGIFFTIADDNLTDLRLLIIGPIDTPYEGGFFYFSVRITPDYPQRPPKVSLITTSAGRIRFNPNLYANGKVCLSILGTYTGPGWTPSLTLETVALSIQSLMNEKPIQNEPGFDESSHIVRDVEGYNDQVRYFTLQAAVCEMVEEKFDEYKRMPQALKAAMHNAFLTRVERYFVALQKLEGKHLHGRAVLDPYQSNKGVYDLQSLRARITALQSRLSPTLSSALQPAKDGDGEAAN